MNDDDVLRVLRRHRPVGPSAAMRSKIFDRAVVRVHRLETLALVAALLLAGGFRVFANRTHRSIVALERPSWPSARMEIVAGPLETNPLQPPFVNEQDVGFVK